MMLRYSIYKECGIYIQENSIEKNTWGKPALKNNSYIHFNISHCTEAIVCAISYSSPVGIDVENIRNYSLYSLKRCFHYVEALHVSRCKDKNREFFRYWTLKESYIKAIGMGMSYPMRSICFDIRGDTIYASRPCCRFVLIEKNEGIIITCCYGVGKEMCNGRLYPIQKCKEDL